MTQEFVTLPREVVKRVMDALYYTATKKSKHPNQWMEEDAAMKELRAALEQSQESPYGECDECGTEYSFDPTDGGSICVACLKGRMKQPQNHVPDIGNMVQAGWKPVPVEPTEEMLRAGCGSESPAMFRESLRRETDGQKTVEMVEKIIQRNLNSYRAMLAAAPQPQVDPEPVTLLRFNTWSSNEGDSWYDCPTDAQIIEDVFGGETPMVGAEYEVSAGWRCVTATYRITWVSEDGDCEAECISHPQENASSASTPRQPKVEQGPVAWCWTGRNGWVECGPTQHDLYDCKPLYVHPQPQPPVVEQEPVARVVGTGDLGGHFDWCKPGLESPDLPSGTPLYTHPQPAQKPLTDEQVLKAVRHLYQSEFAAGMGFPGDLDVARAIEAAHNIK